MIQQLIKEKKRGERRREKWDYINVIADGADLLTGLLIEPIRTNFVHNLIHSEV